MKREIIVSWNGLASHETKLLMEICLNVLMNLIQFTQRLPRMYLKLRSTNRKIIKKVFALHWECTRYV